MKRFIFALMLCLFFIHSALGATWTKPGFELEDSAFVGVLPAYSPSFAPQSITLLKTDEFIDLFFKKSPLIYRSPDDLYKAIDERVTLLGLPSDWRNHTENIGESLALGAKYAFSCLVLECGTRRAVSPGMSIPYNSYNSNYVSGTVNGKHFSGNVASSTTKYINVPETETTETYATCELSLFSLPDGELVWRGEYSDSHINKTFSKLSDLGVLKNIIKKGVKDLSSLTKK